MDSVLAAPVASPQPCVARELDHEVGILTDENATRIGHALADVHDPSTCWWCLNKGAIVMMPSGNLGRVDCHESDESYEASTAVLEALNAQRQS